MNEPEVIQQAISVLVGDQGWIARVVAWMGAIRVVSKLFSHHLEQFLSAALAASEGDPWFKRKAQRILASRLYKVLAFVVDYFLSIKLPQSQRNEKRRIPPASPLTTPGSLDRLLDRTKRPGSQQPGIHPPEGGEGGQ